MAENIGLEKSIQKHNYQNSALLSPDHFRDLKNISIANQILISFVAFLNIALIALVISSLFIESSINDFINIFSSINIIAAFKVTILSLSISALFTIILGLPFSYFISQRKSGLTKLLNVLISLPLLMPPSITGLALLLTFGSRGFLAKLTGNLPFSFAALIIVQTFVMLPLFTQSLKIAFSSVNENIIEAALVGGAEEKDLLFKLLLPLNFRSFLAALIIAVLRGAGEFGATIIFAGNLSGKTQTLTTAIYSLSQSDLSQAIALAVIMISAFFLPLIIIEFKIKS